ncbi:16S rRNA (cytosine(1402)-N(4))-methyltransferase RsmH [Enterobacteriaceae endosymbiont of Donacia bicoloricornis]|uniref:16S rRNA (cytosine(1402)-N(4))-methyltransferase RsmH n=1 Tax=Enterobacteriaceae endosymbiont of Donacia bicoloricornis TaxID=2675772 RepID=UPI001448A794|nr:16S rRNA (cytosine(1402)-N(4))-methyltransferase RsmH [Enterobacteriaceae endosymbiont of Donacia bicoloricornis]QJC37672.1 16S rRNA (cytosine(1402)-N(4))-methyltransferase RsmH [Enterobacteriaceae endosymbiont of Donacia bicoloricornis]
MSHIPVLLKESINSLKIKSNGIYIDATYGCGGHTKLILSKLGNYGRIYAVDCDIKTILKHKIIDDRIIYLNDNFSNLKSILNTKIGKIDGILFDLGISSFQLNNSQRGFSYMSNGPLDMRINQRTKETAFNLLKNINEKKLSEILKKYGEEKYHKKIAYYIKKYIIHKKLNNTQDLSNLICSINKNNKFKHPAKRSFQAIRIFLNKETKELKKALKNSLKLLKKGGILSIISFHSIEDRIVKYFIKKHSILYKKSIYHKLPLTEIEINNFYKKEKKQLKIINRIFPSKKEIFKNPRSRSATLRIAEKI